MGVHCFTFKLNIVLRHSNIILFNLYYFESEDILSETVFLMLGSGSEKGRINNQHSWVLMALNIDDL